MGLRPSSPQTLAVGAGARRESLHPQQKWTLLPLSTVSVETVRIVEAMKGATQ